MSLGRGMVGGKNVVAKVGVYADGDARPACCVRQLPSSAAPQGPVSAESRLQAGDDPHATLAAGRPTGQLYRPTWALLGHVTAATRRPSKSVPTRPAACAGHVRVLASRRRGLDNGALIGEAGASDSGHRRTRRPRPGRDTPCRRTALMGLPTSAAMLGEHACVAPIVLRRDDWTARRNGTRAAWQRTGCQQAASCNAARCIPLGF